MKNIFMQTLPIIFNRHKTILLALFMCITFTGNAQNQKINLPAGSLTIQKIFQEIEKQTSLSVNYNGTRLDTSKTIELKTTDNSTEQILNEIFKGSEFTYIIDKGHIIVKQNPSDVAPANQGKRTVSGTILDETGEPIIGAGVVEKGTTNGVVTDVDGNFTLTVQPGAVFTISYLGYHTIEQPIGSRTHLAVTLQEDTKVLDEVVVVGYGVQKKINLTGSVSLVDGEELTKRPVANITQSLQGMVPGLTVTNNNSGRPGATSSISLRGQGNLSNTANPYVLVDGVEMDLADVNPNDVESISVLKDAAASAIYGARAAYGVILVTTKRGEEGKTRISYQGTFGWNSPTVLPEMANAYDFAVYFNDACANAGVAKQYSDEKLALLKQYVQNPAGIDTWSELNGQNNLVAAFENTARGVGNVDYFDLHYKDAAFKQNHNLSLTGGGKIAQYFVSGGVYTEDGILQFADMDYKRYNFNANLNSQLTKWLKLKLNTKFMHSDSDTPFGTGGLSEGFYHSLARFRPTVNHIDPNGHYTELTMIPYLQSGTYTNTLIDRLTLTGGLEVQPIKNWNIFLDYTYRQNNREYEALNVAPMIPGADNETYYQGTRSELSVAAKGAYTRSMAKTAYQMINLYSNYTFSLADSHNFTVMGGYQEENNDYSYLYNRVADLISTTNPGLGLATGDKTITDTRYSWATRGFFGRINYDYKGRYLLEANGRYDGSSRFASDNRWGFFPSVSAGWNIARESFMEELSQTISLLKLRASWGRMGNQRVIRDGSEVYYTFASTMGVTTLGNYYFSDGRDMYISAPGVIDSKTTWEKVESKEIGIDFGLFGNALTGTFGLFQRDTKDMLGPTADLADMFGASAPNTNNAQMRNRGWEIMLNYRGKIGKDIQYSLGGSISDATSEVTQYENPTGTDPSGNWYVGRKVGEIWGYRTDGLIRTQEEADEYNANHDLSFLSGQKWTPGDVKYLDLNGDGKVNNGTNTLGDMGDMVIIGNSTPRYQYTINGGISWKGISLSMMFQGVGKRDWNPGSGSAYFWGSGAYAQVTVFKQHLDYWTEDNPDAYYPKPYTAGAGAIAQYRNKTSQSSDRYLQNAAYCRLKNLTLSYDLPEIWTSKMRLSKTQIYFSGENLLTFTKLADMFDPEMVFTGNAYTSEGGKNYPMNKVYSIGVIVNF